MVLLAWLTTLIVPPLLPPRYHGSPRRAHHSYRAPLPPLGTMAHHSYRAPTSPPRYHGSPRRAHHSYRAPTSPPRYHGSPRRAHSYRAPTSPLCTMVLLAGLTTLIVPPFLP